MSFDRDASMQLIKEFVEENNCEAILEIVSQHQPADVAEVLTELEAEERGTVFECLDKDTAGLLLDLLDEDVISSLVDNLGAEYIAGILNGMPSDDAADLLGSLPVPVRQKLLGLMHTEEADDVRELLAYGAQTAGGIMTTEYVAIRQDITAGRAIKVLRETAPDAETVYYVYVVDTMNRLVGVISLRELIVADPGTLIEEIMHRKIISVFADMDQEEVAAVVSKYDFLAVPVVDRTNSLIGIITVDDVIDVIYEEAAEDIFRLGGSTDSGENKHARIIRSRLPWLLVTLCEGLLAGRVVAGLHRELSAVVALAYFIPLLTGMGGNVGTQSSTITVRGLATGEIDAGDVLPVAGKEMLTGLILGLINGSIVALVAYVWQRNLVLGLIVGLAMLGNMTTAALMGTLVPMSFKRIGVDPAIASSPFISASIDITGLLIYAVLASLLIGFLL